MKKIVKRVSAAVIALAVMLTAVVFDVPEMIARAADTHTHKVCVGLNCADCGHEDITWTAWEKTDSLPSAEGYYYLTKNVTVKETGSIANKTATTTIAEKVTICLNGKTVTVAAGNYSIFGVSGTLTICDCTGKGKLTGASNNGGKAIGAVYVGGTFNLYSGNISGNTNGMPGVYLSGGGKFNMCGGTLSSNAYGVRALGSGYKFVMNGGEIRENTTSGVWLNGSGTFDMNGGTITKQTAAVNGVGVYVGTGNTFTMNGGSITENTTESANFGTGVCVWGGTFDMNSGTISNNTSGGTGGGVCVKEGTFNFNGGTISENRATGNNSEGGGIYADDGILNITGGTITDNESAVQGGGIYINNKAVVTISDCEITGNTAPSGGGIFYTGSLKLNGKMIVTGNKNADGTANNLYIPSYVGLVEIGASFSAESKIGIQHGANLGCGYNGHKYATKEYGTDISACFFADLDEQVISWDTDKGQLKMNRAHVLGDIQQGSETHYKVCTGCKSPIWSEAHTYNSEITTAATCTAAGVRTLTCSVCQATKTETIDMIAHTEATDSAVEPTCTTPGKTEGKHCSVCKAVLTAQQTIPALEHAWGTYRHNAEQHWQVCTRENCGAENTKSGHIWDNGTETKPATEYEQGEMTYECTVCGQTKTEPIAKLDHTHKWNGGYSDDENYHWHECTECHAHDNDIAHNWEFVEFVARPSCTEKGTEKYSCSDCGRTITKDIQANGHTEVTDNAVEPTCITPGKTEGKHCSVCGIVITAQTTVPANGHTWSAWTIKTPATETSEGEETRECTICKAPENREIPVLEHTHSLTKHDRVEAGCTTMGNIEYWSCTDCGKSFSDENGTTEVTDTAIPAKGHTWGDWTIKTPATETSKGEETRVCMICKTPENREIPIFGHTHSLTKHDRVEAGCTTVGNIEYWSCADCGRKFSDEAAATEVTNTAIPAKGHTEVTDAAVAATCTATGKTEGKHCSVCNAVITPQATIPANGHTWGDWTIKTPATETNKGEETRVCSICKTAESRDIPVTGGSAPDSPDDTDSGDISKEVQPGDNVPPTKLETPLDELIELVLEPNERELVKDGSEIKIILSVDDATKKVPVEDKAAVETEISALSDYKLGQYLDITLLKKIGEQREQKITNTNKPITITFEIPDAFRGKTEYSVIRVHNGETTILKDKDNEPNTVTIETDKFSTYALTYQDTPPNPSERDPSGGNPGGGNLDDSSDPPPSTPSESGNSDITSSGDNSSGISSDTTSSEDNSGSSDTTSNGNGDSDMNSSGGISSSGKSNHSPSESSPSEDNGNPSTGVAVSLVPLTAALAAMVIIANRRRK